MLDIVAEIENLTRRIEDTEIILETINPGDLLYKRGVMVDYNYLLRERARLIKERDDG